MVHLRQLLTAAGSVLDRMMEDWGQPVDTDGKAPEVLTAMRRTQAGLDQAGVLRRGGHPPALSLPKGLLASSIRV